LNDTSTKLGGFVRFISVAMHFDPGALRAFLARHLQLISSNRFCLGICDLGRRFINFQSDSIYLRDYSVYEHRIRRGRLGCSEKLRSDAISVELLLVSAWFRSQSSRKRRREEEKLDDDFGQCRVLFRLSESSH